MRGIPGLLQQPASRRPETRFTYIDVSSVSSATLEIEETQRVVGRDAPSRARKLIRKGDVLFATIRPTLRRIAVVPESLDGEVCSTGYFVLRASAEVLPRFLYYFLQTECFMSSMEALQKGASYPAVTDGDVRDQVIPLPPLPEQRRIVDLLDRAFEGLAVAAANAEKNLENARELFESHLSDVFTRRGEGWVETTLGEIADFKNGLNYTRSSRGQTIPFVGVGDFKSNLVVPVAELESVTIDGALPPDYALEGGDILMVRSNGSRDLVGRSMLVPPMEGPTSFSGFLIRVRGKRSVVDPEFLLYLLRCRDTREQLKRGGGGASISNINQKVLSGLRLRLPSKVEQRRVVKLLEALSVETDRLSRLFEQKQAALAELKKSLLHQAFSGAL